MARLTVDDNEQDSAGSTFGTAEIEPDYPNPLAAIQEVACGMSGMRSRPAGTGLAFEVRHEDEMGDQRLIGILWGI